MRPVLLFRALALLAACRSTPVGSDAVSGADIERIVEKTDRSGPLGFLSAGADSSMGKPGDIEPPVRDPSAYDVVLVCTPVWVWNISPPVRAYLTLMRDRLPAVAFVTVSAATEPQAVVKAMEGVAGRRPSAMPGSSTRISRRRTAAGTWGRSVGS